MGIQTRKPWQGLVCSAAGSTVADFCCTPIDVVKVRLQLSRSGVLGEVFPGSFDCARSILRNEGFSGFFKGLSPAILRANTYGCFRIGLYEPIKNLIAGDKASGQLSLGTKLLAGISSGGIASYIFSPCDLVKIRMQGDREGKRYKGIVDAFQKIAREEGLRGMYSGSSATVGRAAVCAMMELVTYDEFKAGLLKAPWWPFADSLPTHIGASMAAGLLSTIASQPIDLVKSRYMNQPVDASGRGSLYTSPLNCLRSTLAKEGLRGLYAGFMPNYMRLGPHTVIIFVMIEQVRHRTGWAAELTIDLPPVKVALSPVGQPSPA